MQQVKIFKSVETELWSLEKEMNDWVREAGVKVLQVTGNIAPQTQRASDTTFAASDVLLVVLYETSRERAEKGGVTGG